MKIFYWTLGVVIAGAAVTLYFVLGDTQKTIPRITLSYFENEGEVASSISKRLQSEISLNKQYLVGIEPDKDQQLLILNAMKSEFERTNGPFAKVFVDQELALKPDQLANLPNAEIIAVKQNLDQLGEQLGNLEKEGKSYLVITAAIYTNSFIKKNQIHQLEEKYKIKPMTFSLAYFPTTPDDEKLMLFPCSTENYAGTTEWGCAIVNKARFTRRKIDPKNTKPWLGLMDLTGEKDYMLLLKKR